MYLKIFMDKILSQYKMFNQFFGKLLFNFIIYRHKRIQ